MAKTGVVKRFAQHPAGVPEELSVHVGNGLEGYYDVCLAENGLVVWSFGSDPELDPVEVTRPTAAAWELFADAFEEAGVFGWAAGYSDRSVVDGTYWGLRCSWGGRAVESGGANAFPAGFDGFCAAVSRLVGGRTFR
jgi:hypothetical protein